MTVPYLLEKFPSQPVDHQSLWVDKRTEIVTEILVSGLGAPIETALQETAFGETAQLYSRE